MSKMANTAVQFKKRPIVFCILVLFAVSVLVFHRLQTWSVSNQKGVLSEDAAIARRLDKLTGKPAVEYLYTQRPEPSSIRQIQFGEQEELGKKIIHHENEQENVDSLTGGVPASIKLDTQQSPVSRDVPHPANNLREVNYCLHAFYYPWYETIETDGVYSHWNHPILPHWDKNVARKFPSGAHVPPDDIGAGFYPLLGPYSSRNQITIAKHMEYLTTAGVGVIVVSWLPKSKSDPNGKPLDSTLPIILDTALAHRIKVALHFEPYNDRSAVDIRRDVEYVVSEYSRHPAMLKYSSTPQQPTRIVAYIYDTYLVPLAEWARVFTPNGDLTVRGTDYDVFAISLLTTDKDKDLVLKGGFDGFYTYFAVDGFTYGSTMGNWRGLADFAAQHNLLFVPSIGPGYDDTRIRPWNARNVRSRSRGEYYISSISNALRIKPKIVSITSFNEWHEGTQIEPAIPKTYRDFEYKNYLPQDEFFYLKLTYDRLQGVGRT